ncbi:hypothetical protein [Rhizobium bangladeshense]|uniref:hypothetical protein n=1 Tax=Rhizobium bangladeshense TaxID=1138189 RepID=UPI001C82B89B|nr:hypothetical protein [Rhizobium bangladeshense]MBX4896558.1 hypothetical protein [Rhizobium bangladeshense]MBX4900643.1 hypothetical protein [Rhizobium bangladeshense]MBX4912850.1 hypothetical protein [Rhizobium bangladeshense]MBY3617224.1 hypothetical protein [Rhizobium bangladeshense]
MNLIKLISALSCMVASGWVGYSYHADDVTFEPVLAVLAGLAWLFTEYKDGSAEQASTLHPHDVAFGLRFKTLFDERSRRFLREHSFGQIYRDTQLHAIRDASEWRGPEFEFVNGELDNICSEVVRLSDELYEKLCTYAGPVNALNGTFSVPLDNERSADWFGPETTRRIADLNSLARQIAEQLDQFEKVFRRLSPESYRQYGEGAKNG